MKFQSESMCAIEAREFKNTIFPGAVLLPDGELYMLMVTGSDFESSDQKLLAARSKDFGKSWQLEEAVGDLAFPGLLPCTPCAKPTVLTDGTLIAGGYGFHRDCPEMGLSDYAEKFGKFPPADNFFITSSDNGKSWSAPRVMEHGYDGMELSGPLLATPDGELLMFAAPFVLNAPEQKGLTFASQDGGKTWKERARFFTSEAVAPWEVRSIRLASGRIFVVIWAFDLKNSKHLNNHIIYTDDNGKSWSKPIDTNLRGQASNFLVHDGKFGVLQARREGDNPGIYLSDIELAGDTVKVLDEVCLVDARGMANQGKRIEEQFASLKFGQPSAMALPDGAYLLIFWSMENGRYSVKTQRFTLA